ncbi:MAG TPA: PAS domain S-box protein [Deltaproteobacteria bacterium]|nr:PAS domain S-box protein [Deltaproteobacteria bacterium]
MGSRGTSKISARKISKAIFQTMVEKAGDGIFVYQGDRFFYVNPAFEKILGYRAGELENMSWRDVVHPDSLKMVEDRYASRIRGENAPSRYEVTFVTRRSQNRIISLSPSVIVLGGEPATLNIARDITERKQMEEYLTSYNEFLNGLIENSSDAIVASDLQGNAIIFNKAAEEITGYSAKEMLSRRINIDDFMGQGERTRILNLLDQGTAEKPYRLVAEETTLYIKGGTLIPISLSASYVYQGGKPIAGISIFRDLRPMKEVQERLRASEEKYRILVENAKDGIFVYQDHFFKYTNPKFRELLGYSSEELSSMGFRNLVRPELADLIEARYDKRIRGEAVPEEYEIALRAKNGTWRAFEISPSIIRYEKRPATQNVIRDITQKRIQQKALRASETKYRTTVEHTGTAIMLLEENRIVSLVNRQFERLTGYSREEVEGRIPFTEIVHPDDVERMVTYHRARREGKKNIPSEYEFRIVTKAGAVRDAFLTIGLIPGTRQSIVSVMDITEKKNMERELEQTRKMAALGEMSAHVAHEVRNPLQKIKTGMELLRISQPLDEKQQRILEGVTSGIDTLEKFVTQILEWTRSGKINLKVYSISNIIEGLLFNRADQCANQCIEVEVSFDTSHDSVLVDGTQIRQLIENLIDNAIDAMPSGGKLSISTSHVPGYVFKSKTREYVSDVMEIRVDDTGCGMVEDDLQRIFQPFFTRKARGTGLGLALVQKIVDMHHGEIEVSSRAGEGSRFVIRIPVDQASVNQTAAGKREDFS